MADFTIEVPITVKSKGRSGESDVRAGRRSVIRPASGGIVAGGAGGAGGLKALVKIAALVGSLLFIVSALDFIIKPVFAILKALLILLFLPLVPLLKPALMIMAEFVQKLLPIITAISKKVELAFAEGGFGDAIVVLIKEMTGTVIPLLFEFFGGILTAAIELLPQILPVLVEGLVSVIEGLGQFLGDIIAAFVTVIEALIDSGFGQALIDAFIKVIDVLITLVDQLITPLISLFVAIIDALLNSSLLDDLIDAFVRVIEALSPLLPIIIDAMTTVFTEVVKAISAAIVEKIFGSSIFGGGGSSNSEDTGDFILRPNGQLIKTDPRDTIVGFKGPGPSGAGGGTVININNPVVRDDADLRKLTEMISMRLQTQLKGRIS